MSPEKELLLELTLELRNAAHEAHGEHIPGSAQAFKVCEEGRCELRRELIAKAFEAAAKVDEVH